VWSFAVMGELFLHQLLHQKEGSSFKVDSIRNSYPFQSSIRKREGMGFHLFVSAVLKMKIGPWKVEKSDHIHLWHILFLLCLSPMHRIDHIITQVLHKEEETPPLRRPPSHL